jgi:hypothetical protein
MQNSPPTASKPSVPETEAIPPQETLAGGGGGGNAVDLPEAAGSEEPGLPEAFTRKDMPGAADSDEPGLPEALRRKDDGENAAAASEPKPCKESHLSAFSDFFFAHNFKWKAERRNETAFFQKFKALYLA